MSAILSAETDFAVAILSDAAAYNSDGVIIGFRSKVKVSSKVPLAIASRGQVGFGDVVDQSIIELVEDYGFDDAMARLSGMLDQFSVWPDRANKGDWLIAGISERHGARHMTFQNFENFGQPALVLHHPGQIYAAVATGAAGEQTSLAATGVRRPLQGECPEDYFAACGVEMFDYFRRHPWSPAKWGDPDREPQYLIGGRLELAVVDANGVRMRTLHTWPDRVGEPINPYAEPKTLH